MTLRRVPAGALVVRTGPSWRFAGGPLGTRSVSEFDGVTWEGERVRARSVWANGDYRAGPEVAEVRVRAMLETGDGALIYLGYAGRFLLRELAAGTGRVIMTGRAETAGERYGWLNATQIAGEGRLSEGRMTYDLYVLE